MRKYSNRLGVLSLAVLLLSSCEKTFDNKLEEQDDLSNQSIVQVINAAVNVSRNHVWVDASRVTGAAMVSGSVFPATGYGAAVQGGLRAFLIRDTLVSSLQPILSFGENMQVARHYTIFMYDTMIAVKQKTVMDDIVDLPLGTSRIRFANLPYQPGTLIPAFDIYSERLGQNIVTNVQYTDVTPFVDIPSLVTDTFTIRPTGTTTNLQNFTPTPAPGSWNDIRLVVTPTDRRHYTAVFRGSYRTTTTTNANVRTFSLYASY